MGRGRSKAGEQKPTNARAIENMNEAQIDKEIRASERAIERAEKTMTANNVAGQSSERALQEAFPLGAGGDGWSAARRRQNRQAITKNVNMAKKYSEASNKKAAEEKRLKALQEAKKQVHGTGKTQAQIREDAARKAVANAPKTMKWKTTQKGGWANGGYSPKIISSGDIEIRSFGGSYLIYKSGKQVGSASKLGLAKAYAERITR